MFPMKSWNFFPNIKKQIIQWPNKQEKQIILGQLDLILMIICKDFLYFAFFSIGCWTFF